MKQFLFSLICVICFANISTAQTFRMTGSTTYDVKDMADPTPWLGVPTPGRTPIASSGTPASLTCFIEFGDGTFSFSPNGNHTFYGTALNRDITTKFTGIYTGGGKPPSYQVARVPSASISSTSTYVPMTVLRPSESVHITSNIGDVLKSDTMIFVVTYRLEKGKTNENLVFLFNDENTIFDAFSLKETFKDPLNSNTVNFVRTYFSENEIDELSLSPKAIEARKNYGIYKNIVAIKDLKCDGFEHNVFITLIPNENLSVSKAAKTIVRAILTADDTIAVVKEGVRQENNTKVNNGIIGESDLELQVRDNSHDPNYINAAPACMVFPKEGKTVDYHLHFQNTGIGGAPKVRVAIKIPDGVDIEKDIIYKPASTWYKIHGKITNPWPFKNATNDSLIFQFEKDATSATASTTVALRGMDFTDPSYKENETIGDVWFSIKTTTATASIMLAQASIVFYNNGSPIPNEPVITNTAVSQFRDCCDCEKKCDKCKNKGKLWRWLFCKKC